jgi:hypothetical protein
VTPNTFAEAQKLVGVDLTDAERTQAAGSWRRAMAPLYERRTGPTRVELEAGRAPYSRWDPILPGEKTLPLRDRFVAADVEAAPLPPQDDDIAFAPVSQLAGWIRKRQLTSERLTGIYLERIARLDVKLRSVITVTADRALARALQADKDIAAGRYRGPLHGIPWGAKDLIDTAHIPTTYGAEPFRSRVPDADARSSRASMTPERCSSPSSAWARSRSTTSGSAARR